MTDPDRRSLWLAEPANPEPADSRELAVPLIVQEALKLLPKLQEGLARYQTAIASIARGPHWHVFEDRGITPEIMVHRPYAEWTPENPGPLEEAWYPYLDEGQRRWLTMISRQSGGFVIHRHPPPGFGLPPIPAEIRPHEKVSTGRGWHDHKRAYRKAPELLARHLQKKHAKHGEDASIKLGKDATRDDGDVVGWHAHLTKYVFPPSPWIERPCKRDHDSMTKRRLAKHLEKCDGRMERVKDKSRGAAKRIDVHPMAVPLLNQRERVFFGIEGCLKADAILAKDEAVFSVPGVTLWGADELAPFAERYLQNKIVFIVPDADWGENDQVITQAMMARQYLRRLGVESYVAAPPVPENPQFDAGGKLKHNGVDDFLADGGTIDELEIVDREVPREKIREWVRWQDAGVEVLRDVEVLQCLALHAGHAGLADRKADGSLRERPGELHRALSAYAALLGWPDWRRVARAIEELAKLPGLRSDRAITVEGALELAEPEWEFSGEWYRSGLDWEERPLITVAPEFRAIELDPVRLGDFEPGTEQFAMADTTEALRDRKRRLNRERQARYRAAA
jgi:hypothetical protein